MLMRVVGVLFGLVFILQGTHAQKVSRGESEKVADIYKEIATRYLVKADSPQTALTVGSAVSRSMMLKYELLEYMDGLSSRDFEDVSILQLQINKKMKKDFSLNALKKEFYDEVEKKLREVFDGG
jgi:hypothetical protein